MRQHMTTQSLIVAVLVLLVCAAVVDAVARRAATTHESSAGERRCRPHMRPACLPFAVWKRDPAGSVFAPPGELQARTSLTPCIPAYVLLAGAPRGSGNLLCQSPVRIFDRSSYPSRRQLWPCWWCAACSAGSSTASANQLFRQLPDTDSAGDKHRSIGAAGQRSLSHHRPRDAGADRRAVRDRLQRTGSGQAAGGGRRGCLSANAGGGVCHVRGDACACS